MVVMRVIILLAMNVQMKNLASEKKKTKKKRLGACWMRRSLGRTEGIKWNMASPRSVPTAIAVNRFSTSWKEAL